MSFSFNLSLVLAHTILLESKASINEPLGSIHYVNGGDNPAPPANETMASVLSAYHNQLPGLMNVTGKAVGPFEQQLQDAQSSILPQQEALQSQLYAQYAPALNQVGQQMNASNEQAQAQADYNTIKSDAGQGLLSSALSNQKMVDPNFYKTQDQIAGGYSQLLGAQDPTKLSGSEAAQTERGLNRLNAGNGNSGFLAPMNTIGNAMTFGSALANKQEQYGKTLGLGGQLMPQMKSGIDAFQTMFGRPSMPNGSQGQFMGVNQNGFGQQALGQTSQVLGMTGQAASQANEINANRRDTLDRVNGTMSSLPSYS